jgi:hypothetical protein
MKFWNHRNTLRKIRKIRKFSGRTKFTRSLHNFSGICLALCAVTLFNDSFGQRVFLSYLAAGFSAIAFVIETKKITVIFLEKWWKKWFGKLMYSLITIVMTLVSTSLSKQIIHHLVGVNPNYFPEYVALLSIAITLFFILFLIQLAIFLLSFIYIFQGFGIMLVDMFFVSLVGFSRSFLPFYVRIMSGKKEKYPLLVAGWYPLSMETSNIGI